MPRKKALTGRVKIRSKHLKDGRESLYLDTYQGGKRSYEFLELYLTGEKRVDAETMRTAEALRANREIEVATGRAKLQPKHQQGESFVEFYRQLAEEKDTAAWRSVLSHLLAYSGGSITFGDLSEEWLQGFRTYLIEGRKANTGKEYTMKLRAGLRHAVKLGKLPPEIVDAVESVEGEDTHIEFLTLEELRQLQGIECDYPEVARAFIFGCLTGLRLSDIEALTWGKILKGDNGGCYVHFRQIKTQREERLPLSRQALELLGDRQGDSRAVFDLPSRSCINETLVRWCRDAGVRKHIHFHCSRHTNATLMLSNGTDLYLVGKMLGHRNIATTQRYAKIIDEQKVQAANSIPNL